MKELRAVGPGTGESSAQLDTGSRLESRRDSRARVLEFFLTKRSS